MNGKRWRFWIALALLAMLASTALGASAAGYLPREIDGNGTGFAFDTRSGRVTVPDCVLERANAFCTTWDIDDSFFSSGEYINIFDHLAEAKAAEMPRLEAGKYDRYEYAGLELFVRSAADPSTAARIRMWPRNRDDTPADQDIVDLEIVYYENYDQPDEEIALQQYQLTSYNLWNSIVGHTMEFYEPEELTESVRVEYHSLQNDPGAHATPSEDPPALKKASMIQEIAGVLASAERLEHNMAGEDYMHLRFVSKEGKRMNVYLQTPNDEKGNAGKVYARMGAYCYLIDKDAIQSALNAAGIPLEMMA